MRKLALLSLAVVLVLSAAIPAEASWSYCYDNALCEDLCYYTCQDMPTVNQLITCYTTCRETICPVCLP